MGEDEREEEGEGKRWDRVRDTDPRSTVLSFLPTSVYCLTSNKLSWSTSRDICTCPKKSSKSKEYEK